MNIIRVVSYEDFISRLTVNSKVYLLLYKEGSESSDCALSNIIAGSETIKNHYIYYADVNTVRDIHTRYGISTVPVLMEFRNGNLINVIKGCNDAAQYKALFEDNLFRVEQQNKNKKPLRIIVYSTPACSWCNTLKNYLSLHNIPYTDIDLSRNHSVAEALIKKSGQAGVPQTEINGEIIVGFDKKRLDKLLNLQS